MGRYQSVTLLALLAGGCRAEGQAERASPRQAAADVERPPTEPELRPTAAAPPEGRTPPARRAAPIAGDKACRSDPAACVRRAVALTRTDLPRAAGMFEVACEEGDAAGCGNFAVMLRDGRGVGADRDRATELLEHACEHGHAPSCENRRALDR